MTTTRKNSTALAYAALADGIRPVPRLTVSEWADQYRVLAAASAEQGRYRTARTPYLREIMDAMSPTSPIQRVVFMKSAQVGATEAANNVVGCYIDIAPCPILMVMPTQESAKQNSQVRITPMIEASPALRARILPARKQGSENTVLRKKFPGGFLAMVGASSSTALRSLPIRVAIADEPDAYPLDLDGEGSPLKLIEARTATFANRKLLYISTPTVAGRSVIEKEYNSTDQRRYYVPCPHCQHEQPLEFGQLEWEPRRPDTAHYKCAGCGEKIAERHKPYMLAHGKWIATAPENANPTRVGYHINALYSPLGWFSWANVAREWEDAQGDANKEKSFQNVVMGLPYAENTEAPDWQNLLNRRGGYTEALLPASVGLLTAGADVQKNRIEVEVVAWGPRRESWSVEYLTFQGDTAQPDVWQEMSALLQKAYRTEDGATLSISALAVDTGYNTQAVYRWVASAPPGKVLAVKGYANHPGPLGMPTPIEVTQAGKKRPGGVKVWKVGTDVLKSEIYGYLAARPSDDGEVPLGYMHFPATYGPDYFKGLTAEVLTTKVVAGMIRHEWAKTRERNEPLDCRVYALAAAYYRNIHRVAEADFKTHFRGQGKQAGRGKNPAPQSPPPGSFWAR